MTNCPFTTKQDLADLEYRLDRKMDKKTDRVLTVVDGVVKKLDIIETEITSNQAAHDRFEKRIGRLEAHLGLQPLKA